MKPDPKITSTEWLAELARLSDRADAGLTTNEWAEQMGLSVDHSRKRLQMARKAGWLIVGRRRAEAMDGRACMVPVYQIVQPKSGTIVPKSGAIVPKGGKK